MASQRGDRLDRPGDGGGGRYVHDGGRLYVVATMTFTTQPLADLEPCCHMTSYSDAIGACEEYTSAWLSMQDGARRSTEYIMQQADEADPDDPLPTDAGFHVRHDHDASCMRLLIYEVKAGLPANLVRSFGVYPCSKWIDDFIDDITPGVLALEASDRTTELFGAARSDTGEKNETPEA